jgi:hypothetical protein
MSFKLLLQKHYPTCRVCRTRAKLLFGGKEFKTNTEIFTVQEEEPT